MSFAVLIYELAGLLPVGLACLASYWTLSFLDKEPGGGISLGSVFNFLAGLLTWMAVYAVSQ